MEKGFGRPVFAIGVNHFRGEGERDQVLLELIWVWVLDEEKGLAMGCVLDDGECFPVGCVLNGEGSGDWEKQNFYEEESIYI